MRTLFFALVASLTLGVGCDSKKSSPVSPRTDASQDSKPKADQGPVAQVDPHARLKAPRTEFVLMARPTTKPAAVAADVKKIEAFLSKETGYTVEVRVPGSYKASIDMLKSDQAQVSYFGEWSYLAGHMKADMMVAAAATIDGKPDHLSRIYTLQSSKIKDIKGLKGKRMAFTTPDSAAGFLFPSAKLAEAGVVDPLVPGEAVTLSFAGSEENALRALLAKKVDAVATSARAPKAILSDAEQSKLKVLSEQGPVPNPSIAIKSTMRPEAQEKFKKAILKLTTPEIAASTEVVFGIQGLVAREHYQHADALQQAADLVELRYPL